MRPRDFLIIPATSLGVMILNVAISIGVVWVYATFINPGHPLSRYEAFAATAAPISSIVAGIPLMLLAGFFLSRGRSARAALLTAGAMALVYIVIDSAVTLAAAAGSGVWAWEAISHSTKLLAALAGAAFRSSR